MPLALAVGDPLAQPYMVDTDLCHLPALRTQSAPTRARGLFLSTPAAMPVVSVNRDLLFEKLGRTYSEYRVRCLSCAVPR